MLASVPSAGVLACLALFTMVWPIAAWQMTLLWRHATKFFDVAGVEFRYRRARTRCMPVVVAAGLPFLVSGWTFVFDEPSPNGPADAIQLFAVLGFVASLVAVFVLAPSVFLLNRPKLLVPPHLRQEPGYLTERRTSQ